MKTIKRIHKTKKEALEYIQMAGLDIKFYSPRKLRNGKFWVGTEFEWLNR